MNERKERWQIAILCTSCKQAGWCEDNTIYTTFKKMRKLLLFCFALYKFMLVCWIIIDVSIEYTPKQLRATKIGIKNAKGPNSLSPKLTATATDDNISTGGTTAKYAKFTKT